MGKRNDPHLRRVGDPDDHDAEREALRHELGMGAVRVPLPVDVDRVMHGDAPDAGDGASGGESVMDLIAHQKPPVRTHFVEGALDEHARHQGDAAPEDEVSP